MLRQGLALGLLVAIVSLPCAAEIPGRAVRVGVLTDMGGANADASGEGSVVAAKLAAEDAAAFMPGVAVSVIGADHQNKADVASSIARDWIANQAINVIADVPVSSAGLAVVEAARGLYLAEPFHWDLNDGTRAFSARFAERMRGRKPTMIRAGVHSGVLNYLKAVHAADSTEVPALMAELRRTPPDDPVLGKGVVRLDGRVTHDFYLFQVKRPDQSTAAWDDYAVVRRIPGEAAFRPLQEGGCPLVPAP